MGPPEVEAESWGQSAEQEKGGWRDGGGKEETREGGAVSSLLHVSLPPRSHGTQGCCRPPRFLMDIKSFTGLRSRHSEKPKIASRAKGGPRKPKLLLELQQSQEKTQLKAEVLGHPWSAVLQAPALPCSNPP